MTHKKTATTGDPDRRSTSETINLRSRLLVVDDKPLILHLVTLVLNEAGYEVDTAEDGAIAWDLLQLTHYDLLITDNDMPHVSGIELLKKIYAAHMSLPVIMLSGTMPTDELARQPWLEPTARLLKPFVLVEFLETVKSILRATENTTAKPRPQIMPGDAAPPKAAAANTPTRNPTDLSRRILVVDDNCDTRQLSIDALVGSGYDAEGVIDGVAGWEALQTYDYDLVITDNKMPRMTGVEMIGKLRSANIAVPVIMATGKLPMDEFVRKPWLKPEAMLERPFTNDDLLESVKEVLGTDDSQQWK